MVSKLRNGEYFKEEATITDCLSLERFYDDLLLPVMFVGSWTTMLLKLAEKMREEDNS